MTEAIDLSGAQPADTYDLNMIDPRSGKPSGWVVVLAGPANPKTLALAESATRKRLRRSAAIDRAQINGRKWTGDDERTPEDEMRETVTSVVSRIVSWSPNPKFDGEEIVFTDENAIKLFMDRKKGAFFNQIVDYLTSERAFMPASAQV